MRSDGPKRRLYASDDSRGQYGAVTALWGAAGDVGGCIRRKWRPLSGASWRPTSTTFETLGGRCWSRTTTRMERMRTSPWASCGWRSYSRSCRSSGSATRYVFEVGQGPPHPCLAAHLTAHTLRGRWNGLALWCRRRVPRGCREVTTRLPSLHPGYAAHGRTRTSQRPKPALFKMVPGCGAFMVLLDRGGCMVACPSTGTR
jgi:hypothetical protein